jgi:hypothetical protein
MHGLVNVKFVLSVRPCVRMLHLYWKKNRIFFLEVWIWRGNIRTYSVGSNKLTVIFCVCVCACTCVCVVLCCVVLCTFPWHDLHYLDTFIFMQRANENISIWNQHYCCRPTEYFALTKAPLELCLRFQKHGAFLILRVEGIHVLWNLQKSCSVWTWLPSRYLLQDVTSEPHPLPLGCYTRVSNCCVIQDSSVGIVTRLQARRTGSWILNKDKRSFSSSKRPHWFWVPPSLLCNGYWCSSAK